MSVLEFVNIHTHKEIKCSANCRSFLFTGWWLSFPQFFKFVNKTRWSVFRLEDPPKASQDKCRWQTLWAGQSPVLATVRKAASMCSGEIPLSPFSQALVVIWGAVLEVIDYALAPKSTALLCSPDAHISLNCFTCLAMVWWCEWAFASPHLIPKRLFPPGLLYLFVFSI